MTDDLSQEQAESIVVRIRKLMELSKSSNENEAASAAAKAQELLIKYNVDAAAVENVKLGGQDTHLVKEFKEMFDLNQIQWKLHLGWAVARGNLCRAVSSGKGMYFLGKKSNIQVATYLLDTLIRDLERIADEKWKQIEAIRDLQEKFPSYNLFTDKSLRTVHGKTWKASFYVGAVETIRQRLEGNLTEIEAGDSNTRALISLEGERLEAFKKQEFTRLVSGGSLTAQYDSAYKTGRAAGNKVQFSRGISSGDIPSGPKLLGGGKNN